MPAWTPGPWNVRIPSPVEGGYVRIISYDMDANDEGRAIMYNTAIADVLDNTNEGANAHLIAAAPDLAEALKELCDCLKCINDKEQSKELWGPRIEAAYQNARTALAKARGNTADLTTR